MEDLIKFVTEVLADPGRRGGLLLYYKFIIVFSIPKCIVLKKCDWDFYLLFAICN